MNRYPHLDTRNPGAHRRYRLVVRYAPAGRLTERGTGRRYNVERVYADSEN